MDKLRHIALSVSDPEDVFYEVKYRTPDGIVFDITESGWKGAVKDVIPAAQEDN
jgi:methylmalonyl-CoA/ethylmalonyl-CoA epimerase